ncbi:hypothetical protein A9Q99_25975 [Gammaproteobacteria bacterium 45_16_T64]|nr:hypothetical protein A9Q99_25975 [Gammaproteobacteria bacterium 45_16_T64]
MSKLGLFHALKMTMLMCVSISTAYAEQSRESELSKTVEDLKKRLEQLERRDAKPSRNNNGGKVEWEVGGYAKLDMVYSSTSAGANSLGDEFLISALVPTSSDGEDDQIKLTARESRLWVKANSQADGSTINFLIEGDFFGNKPSSSETLNNNSDFRLRQAFGEVSTKSAGRYLMGQAWTTFQNLSAFPHTTTLGELPGQAFSRTPMIRWTMPFDGDSVQLAIENPETHLRDSSNNAVRPDDDRIPDFIARYNLKKHSVSALLRQLRCDMPGSCSDSQQAWGVSVAGRIDFGKRDQLRYQAHWGDGIGRFVSGTVFPGGIIDSAGGIDLVDVRAFMLSYQHRWASSWNSALIFNTAKADGLDSVTSATEEVTTYHINTMWLPTKNMRVSLEYIRAESERISGLEGDLDRVIFSTKYNF